MVRSLPSPICSLSRFKRPLSCWRWIWLDYGAPVGAKSRRLCYYPEFKEVDGDDSDGSEDGDNVAVQVRRAAWEAATL